MSQLAFSAIHHRAVRDKIRAQDLDEQTLADTVEDLTDLHEIVVAVIGSGGPRRLHGGLYGEGPHYRPGWLGRPFSIRRGQRTL